MAVVVLQLVDNLKLVLLALVIQQGEKVRFVFVVHGVTLLSPGTLYRKIGL